MKKISQDPFSNGTEFMNWESNNCDRCVKASRYIEKEDRYTPVRCAVQRDIFIRMGSSEPISQRSYDACQQWNCPYRKTERKRRNRRKPSVRNLPKLF